MPIDGLTIIGESINDSVPSTKKLFDANDIEGLKQLAALQEEQGAGYIDVNVGGRSPEFMADLVRQVQSVTTKPLAIDTPDYATAKAGLEACDPARGKPVLNSISPLRVDMFDLYEAVPFMPILMVSERIEGGQAKPNDTAEQTFATTVDLVNQAKAKGIAVSECIVDPAIAPIGSDMEGHLKRIVQTCEKIHANAELAGIHMSVGLSNFTIGLPSKRANGEPVKGPLESAFLTITRPLGMDHIIGSVKRKYDLLSDDHDALRCIKACLELDDLDILMRVQEFYS